MLRLHFTPDDLARVRVAAGPDHLWEIANSFQGLFHGADTLSFGPWRRLVRPRLGGPADRLLAGLLPGRGYFPDFLTPAAGGQGELAAALDTVLGAPRAALRDDLALLAASPHRRRPLPDLTGALDSARSSGTRRPVTTSKFFFYNCARYHLSDWNGTGNFYDAQTGGVTSYFYGQSGNVLRSFTPDFTNHDQDWGPVWSIRNC